MVSWRTVHLHKLLVVYTLVFILSKSLVKIETLCFDLLILRFLVRIYRFADVVSEPK